MKQSQRQSRTKIVEASFASCNVLFGMQSAAGLEAHSLEVPALLVTIEYLTGPRGNFWCNIRRWRSELWITCSFDLQQATSGSHMDCSYWGRRSHGLFSFEDEHLRLLE
mmetsp:Transcript_23881/g.28880  ORF Transcript_23881/g.28880 Transcript_23881/m.28880 type:complete len:109 (+) Transcript_23881:1222-1548(+)